MFCFQNVGRTKLDSRTASIWFLNPWNLLGIYHQCHFVSAVNLCSLNLYSARFSRIPNDTESLQYQFLGPLVAFWQCLICFSTPRCQSCVGNNNNNGISVWEFRTNQLKCFCVHLIFYSESTTLYFFQFFCYSKSFKHFTWSFLSSSWMPASPHKRPFEHFQQ